MIHQRITTSAALQLRRGDCNAFTSLGTDNRAKIVILPTILMGTSRLTPEIVFGRILPGLALTRLVELSTFANLRIRLACREDRTDVAAIPYGISTPVMFVYLFGIMGPVYSASNDPPGLSDLP